MQTTPSGKVALVTGGAGGIGSAVVRALAAAGASVIVGYNGSEEAAAAMPTPCRAVDHRAAAARVTGSELLQALAAEVAASHGRLDILVNCAGTTRFVPHGDLDALDDALVDTILAVNVRGVIATTRAHSARCWPGRGRGL